MIARPYHHRVTLATSHIVDRRELRDKLADLLGLLQKAPRAA